MLAISRTKQSAVASRIRHRVVLTLHRITENPEAFSVRTSVSQSTVRSFLVYAEGLACDETRSVSTQWTLSLSARTSLANPVLSVRSPGSLGSIRSFHNSLLVAADEKTEAPAAEAAETPSTDASQPVEYSTPELTQDAAQHKAGLSDPERPPWQNPLHHNNEEMSKVFREDFDSQEAFEAAQLPAPPLGDAAPAYIQELADEIVNLTLLEMNELVNKIAQHYGFHEGMLSPDSAGGDGGADDDDDDGGAEAAPAKTAFDVRLVSFDDKAKIKVIKEIRAIAGLGLKEAKEMVEGAPKIVMKQIKQEQADEIKAKLEEIGAVIEIV